MFNRRVVSLGLVFLSLGFAPALQAAPQYAVAPTPGANKPLTKQEVQQKLMLVQMMLGKSGLVDRAAKSDDPALKQQADRVMNGYREANNALSNGDVATADKLCNEVLDIMSVTAAKAPDPARLEAEQKQKYDELVESMQGLEVTYREMQKTISSRDPNYTVISNNLGRTSQVLSQARGMAQQRQYKEASALLDRSYSAGVADLNRIMGSAVMSYEVTFNTPADEYKHELARYKSFEDLIPVAHEQLKPDSGKRMMSDRAVGQAKQTAQMAQSQASGGNYQAAIAGLNDATNKMKTALKILGLNLPD